MKIRASKCYESMVMMSGMYSRSEGPDVLVEYVTIHPDDWANLVDPVTRNVETFLAAPPELKREYWTSYRDIEYAGEEGDTLADEYSDWAREYKIAHYTNPEFDYQENNRRDWRRYTNQYVRRI